MFKHEIVANRMIDAGVSREKARKIFERLFAKYGHFRNDGKQASHDALKAIAYFY